MKIAIVLSALISSLISSAALASHVELCQFKATAEETQRLATLNKAVSNSPEPSSVPYIYVVSLKITEVVTQPGSYIECADKFLGKTQQLVIDGALINRGTLARGAEVRLNYQYFNGRAPNGMHESERWSLVQD